MAFQMTMKAARRVLRRCAPAFCGLAIGLAALALYWPGIISLVPGLEEHRDLKPLQSLDLRIGDALHGRFSRPPEPTPRIGVIGITAEDLDRYGPLPWPRDRHGTLVRKLAGLGASVIGFDIFFPYPTREDAEFARAVRESGARVIMPRCGLLPGAASRTLASPIGPAGPALAETAEQLAADVEGVYRTQLVPAAPVIYGAALDVGHVNIFYDDDLVARRVPAAVGEPDAAGYYLPMGILLGLAGESRPLDVRLSPRTLLINGQRIPLDGAGRILVNFRPFDRMIDTRPCELQMAELRLHGESTLRRKPISFYSYSDIMADRVPPGALKDARVLVGQCAWGSREDLHLTPQGSQYGVLVQAMLLHTMMGREFLTPVSTGWTFAAVLALSALAGILFFGVRFRTSTYVTVVGGCLVLALGVGLVLCAVGLLRRHGLVLDASPFLLALGLNLVVGAAANAARMTREADRRSREMDLLVGAGKRHMTEIDQTEATPPHQAIPGSRQMAFSASYSARSPEIVVDTFSQTVPCEGAALLLVGQGAALAFERTVFHGFRVPEMRFEVEAIAVRLAWETLKRNRPMLLSAQDSAWKNLVGERSTLRSLLSLAIVARGELLAVVLMFNKRPTPASPEPEFTEDDLRLVAALRYQSAALLENARRYRLEYEMFDGFARSLAKAVDFRDRYTRGHSERVAEFSAGIALELSLTRDEVEIVTRAATLHDLGKIGVNDMVLKKPGRLTQEEFAEIRVHAANGYEILRAAPSFEPLLPGIRNHHERYDGNGYPDGLIGNQIPLLARIIAAADAYDAMTSDRPYRKALPEEKARGELLDGAGTQFDPQVVEAFLRYMDRRAGRRKRPEATQAVAPVARHTPLVIQAERVPIRQAP